jgi:hypothetical protein
MRHYFCADRRNVPKYDARQSLLRKLHLHMHCQKLLLRCLTPAEDKLLMRSLTRRVKKFKIYFTYSFNIAQVVNRVNARRSDLELTCSHFCHFSKFLGNLFFFSTRAKTYFVIQ